MTDKAHNFVLIGGLRHKKITPEAAALVPHEMSNGTLCYSKAGLIVTCIFLLLGGFGFGMILQTVYNLLPLQLKDAGGTNTLIALFMTTLPSIITTVTNPVFSTWSDHTRSRMGRRKPFLLLTAPLLALCMIVMGWAPELVQMCGCSNANAVWLVIGVASVFWNILFMVPNTVLWYLFPDVIPQSFIGRYMAFFNVISQGAGFTFSYCLMGLAEKYIGWLYTGVAVFYVVSILLLVCGVKEGEYPPIEAKKQKKSVVAAVKSYVKECYTIPFYYWFFSAMALSDVSMVCRTMFNMLYAKNTLGIGLERIGEISGYGAIVGLCLSVPFAWCSDKLHAMRFFAISLLTVVMVNVFGFFYVHDETSFLVITIALAVVYTMQSISTIPVCVAILPKAKYGQFCSANALFRSIFMSLSGMGGGWLFDKLNNYQYIYAWDFVFTVSALGCFIVLLKKWEKLGGPDHYQAPENDGEA